MLGDRRSTGGVRFAGVYVGNKIKHVVGYNVVAGKDQVIACFHCEPLDGWDLQQLLFLSMI